MTSVYVIGGSLTVVINTTFRAPDDAFNWRAGQVARKDKLTGAAG
ncbi:MAG TPA: hypothetical protein VER76_09465 [Pyrinomonadaceae bacterium]|nr:hypothetical protein [Pyrinomonadaceae bacterium]